ncbi:MAG: hypothetical protein BJ554DRAFT_1242 [Olpidium bornovanus]|uniref:Uncharacterized protein n=1 Tax=Olpidium bornovanus TaxID=278681 RepID=A0A8H8DHY0_9FUNG|nr:MAG: hypothetical protein BJ554DRAFT_1242 [Olpidium bornovanus]
MASGEPAAGSGSRRQAGTGGLGAGEGGAPAGPPEAVAGGAPAAEQAAAPPASQQRHALHTHQHARLVSKLAPAAAAADGEDAPGRIREDEVEEDEEENDDGGEDDDPEQPLPRDARILSLLLASMGVTEADRMVVPQLLEFAHRKRTEKKGLRKKPSR